MTKLKRCPCCHSDDVGPSFSFQTEDDEPGITIRCGSCGLMLTPVLHPTDEDGDLCDEDSDYVEEILDDLACDWNKRAKDTSVDAVMRLGRAILTEIDKYANKVHGVEQIHQVETLIKRLRELEEIHDDEVKGNLVKDVHDTGSRVTQRHHRERITDSVADEPAPWVGTLRPMDWDATSVAPSEDRLSTPGLSETSESPAGAYICSSSLSDGSLGACPAVEPAVRFDGGTRSVRIGVDLGEGACCASAPGCSG